MVKRFGGAIPFLEFFFFRLAGTAAVVLVLAVAQGELAWSGATAWLILIPAATVTAAHGGWLGRASRR